MKKFFVALMALLMLSAQVEAKMLLHVVHSPLKINFFDDSCQIGETQLKKLAGVAKISPDFYFHYDTAANFSRLGDSDVNNTVGVNMLGKNELTIVEDYDGTAFYLIKNDTPPGDAIKILGKRDGKWTILLDVQKAFREKVGWNFYCTKIIAVDDKIIFRYEVSDEIIDGVCTWDAANQSFRTEVIVR